MLRGHHHAIKACNALTTPSLYSICQEVVTHPQRLCVLSDEGPDAEQPDQLLAACPYFAAWTSVAHKHGLSETEAPKVMGQLFNRRLHTLMTAF